MTTVGTRVKITISPFDPVEDPEVEPPLDDVPLAEVALDEVADDEVAAAELVEPVVVVELALTSTSQQVV